MSGRCGGPSWVPAAPGRPQTRLRRAPATLGRAALARTRRGVRGVQLAGSRSARQRMVGVEIKRHTRTCPVTMAMRLAPARVALRPRPHQPPSDGEREQQTPWKRHFEGRRGPLSSDSMAGAGRVSRRNLLAEPGGWPTRPVTRALALGPLAHRPKVVAEIRDAQPRQRSSSLQLTRILSRMQSHGGNPLQLPPMAPVRASWTIRSYRDVRTVRGSRRQRAQLAVCCLLCNLALPRWTRETARPELVAMWFLKAVRKMILSS